MAQHSRRPGGPTAQSQQYHSHPNGEDNRELDDSVGDQVFDSKHVYSRQPTFSTPTLSMSVQLPNSRVNELHGSADPMYYGHDHQMKTSSGHSATLSSSLPSTGIYQGNNPKPGFTSTPRSDMMYLAGSGSTLNTSAPSSTPSSSLLLPPPSPYDQQQQHYPLDWSYAYQTYSPFPSTTASGLRMLETVSPSVDTSAFLVSPTSAGETLDANGAVVRSTSTTSTGTPMLLSSPGMPQSAEGHLYQQHHNNGYDATTGMMHTGSSMSHDMLMDGLSPNPGAFRGLGLEHDDLGLGSMPMMMGSSHQFDPTSGIGLELPGSNWQSSGSANGLFLSDNSMSTNHHAPSYHQDPQQQQHHHQHAPQHFQPSSFPGDFGEGQDFSQFQPQPYMNLPIPDLGTHTQLSRSPLTTTHNIHSTDQMSYALPTQHILPHQDYVPPMDQTVNHHEQSYSQPVSQPITSTSTSTSTESRPLFPIPGTTIDPATAFTVQGYLAAANKYAFGERKVVIHSPRVGQKSYGTEKRFICPPPVAVLHGRTWWTKKSNTLQSSPVVNISITDETRAPDVRPNWHTTSNRYLEEPSEFGFPNGEAPFIGKACGKALHISDTPARKAKSSVQAMVTIMASLGESSGAAERRPVVGTFESKPITIVSKPSKKRQNTRNSELFLQHGTPVSLYNRIRSQTSSTKFLSVATDITRQLGSDGKAIPTHPSMARTDPAFVADQVSWDPLLIWLVDPQAHDRPQPPVTGREAWDGYAPPADAIKPPDNIPVPVVCYNNTIRLQCPATGLTSPVLVIRRVDNGTTAYGGEGVKRDGFQGRCALGELTGEPVSQLHKIALELYAVPNLPNLPVYGQDFRYSGQWMTAEKDRIEYRLGKTARTMAPENPPPTPRSRPHSASSLPSSPNIHITGLKPLTSRGTGPVTPTSTTSTLPNTYVPAGQDFFGGMARQPTISQGLGGAGAPYGIAESPSRDNRAETNGPGPMRRRRTSSNASVSNKSSLGLSSSLKGSTMSPPAPPKPMRTISGEIAPASESTRWFVELAETATWTIVGAETKVYTFWVNPDHKIESPLTPLPSAERCVAPGGQNVDTARRHVAMMPSMSTLPQATIYGTGFAKDEEGNPRYTVWWGTEPAEENEYKCTEVLSASTPRAPPTRSRANNKVPIALVRQDGMLVVPTGLTWTR